MVFNHLQKNLQQQAWFGTHAKQWLRKQPPTDAHAHPARPLDQARDSRYDGSCREVWLATKAYTWTAAATIYLKDPAVVGR